MISFSDNIVKGCIDDIANDILKQLVSRIQASNAYDHQTNKSTNIASLANLLAFVRYECNGELHEVLKD